MYHSGWQRNVVTHILFNANLEEEKEEEDKMSDLTHQLSVLQANDTTGTHTPGGYPTLPARVYCRQRGGGGWGRGRGGLKPSRFSCHYMNLCYHRKIS